MDRITKFVIGYAIMLILIAQVASWANPRQAVNESDGFIEDTIVEDPESEYVEFDMFSSKIPTAYEYLTVCALYGITDAEIVFAQSCLESGHFRSDQFRNKNNHLGIRMNGKYKDFDHWSECLKIYAEKVQYKKRKGEDHYAFLKRIGYAEDPDYINKVKRQVSANRKKYAEDFERFDSEP